MSRYLAHHDLSCLKQQLRQFLKININQMVKLFEVSYQYSVNTPDRWLN